MTDNHADAVEDAPRDDATAAAAADGGVARDDREDRGDGGDLDVSLPEDSLLTREEYLELYRVASGEPAFGILTALSEVDRLSASELGDVLDRDGNDLHYHLRKLKRTGLVRNRRDPNTGTDQPYSYYTLTDLGHTVLTYGLKTGVEKLAAEEAALDDHYGE